MFSESGQHRGGQDASLQKTDKILNTRKVEKDSEIIESPDQNKIPTEPLREPVVLLREGERCKLNISISNKKGSSELYDNVVFDIKRKIGAGGQGSVFEAEHPSVDLDLPEVPRRIAIKTVEAQKYENVRGGSENSLFLRNAYLMNEFHIARVLSNGSKKPNRVTGEVIEAMPEGMIPKYYGVTKLFKENDKGERSIAGYAFAMEQIKGVDLKKILEKRQEALFDFAEKGKVDVSTAAERSIFLKGSVEEVIEIVNIVAELHKRNVIFNDLKPQNMIRRANGGLCFVDFGSAQFYNPKYSHIEQRKNAIIASEKKKIEKQVLSDADVMSMSEEARADLIKSIQEREMESIMHQIRKVSPINDHFVERKKYILGSLDYMAPEHYFDTANVSLESDIFSLGVILFEYIYGEGVLDKEGVSLEDVGLRMEEQARRKMEGKHIDLENVMMQTKVSVDGENHKKRLATLEEESKLIALLKKCIDPDVKKRPTASQLAGKLEEIKSLLSEQSHWSIKELSDTDVNRVVRRR